MTDGPTAAPGPAQVSLAEVHEAIAATRPDAECLVYRDQRFTWAEITERTRRLANHLLGEGLGFGAMAGCDTRGRAASAAPSSSALSGRTASAGAESATPSATPTPSATSSGSSQVSVAGATVVEAPRLTAALERYLSARPGTLGLEVADLRRQQVFRHQAREGYCFSTIKVLLLITLLRQRQEGDADLSRTERRLVQRMITRSDNAAADTLLAQVGLGEVVRVAGLVGMERTQIDSGWWGLWRTVPGDLNLMVDAVLSSERVLDGARRTVARFLLAEVVPAQRWGVFATESRRVHVAGKNGWGPLPDGYRANSTGWVSGDGRDYVLSILSRSPDGVAEARATVGGVSRLVHRALGQPLA